MKSNEIAVKMILDRWQALLKNCDNTLDAIADEQLLKEVAPGKNRGIYLLGHLVAVHDDMLPLLGLGERKHAELFEIFVQSPDKANTPLPSCQELRVIWKEQLETLGTALDAFSPDEWFQRHTSVSEQDFSNEPHRNKLNIILTRTTHLAYHLGQLALLK